MNVNKINLQAKFPTENEKNPKQRSQCLRIYFSGNLFFSNIEISMFAIFCFQLEFIALFLAVKQKQSEHMVKSTSQPQRLVLQTTTTTTPNSYAIVQYFKLS